MTVAEAAKNATKNSARVFVKFEHEDSYTPRVLKWDGDRPYVMSGWGSSRRRAYLTAHIESVTFAPGYFKANTLHS